LQIKEAVVSSKDEEEASHNIFEVFAAKKRKHKVKPSKLPELTTPLPKQAMTHIANPHNSWPNAQFCYQSNTEDQHLISELEGYLMQGKLSLTTPAHIFAASPAICKDIVNKLKVQKVETNEYKAVVSEEMAAHLGIRLSISANPSPPSATWDWVEDSSNVDDE